MVDMCALRGHEAIFITLGAVARKENSGRFCIAWALSLLGGTCVMAVPSSF